MSGFAGNGGGAGVAAYSNAAGPAALVQLVAPGVAGQWSTMTTLLTPVVGLRGFFISWSVFGFALAGDVIGLQLGLGAVGVEVLFHGPIYVKSYGAPSGVYQLWFPFTIPAGTRIAGQVVNTISASASTVPVNISGVI